MGQADQQVRALGRGQPGEQGEAELARLDGFARGDQHPHQHLVGRGRHRLLRRGEPAGVPRRALGGGQSARGERPPRALDQPLRGLRGRARRFRQLRGQLAGGAREAGVRPFDRGPRPLGQAPSLRREQVVQHGLAGERVAEDEAVAVDRHDLRVDGGPQPVDDRSPVDVGDARQQLPVEPAAQHRRGADHPPGRRVEHPRAARDRLPQARGNPGCELARRDPHPVLTPQRARRDQAREQLLDEERRAVAVGAHEAGEPGGRARRGEAGRHHPVDVVLGQRPDADDRGGVAALQPFEQLRGVALGPRGRHAQHGLGGQRVAQVVEGGQGLRVGPVQVLHHEHAAPPVAVGAQEPHDGLGQQERRVLGGLDVLVAPPTRDEPSQVPAEPGERGGVGHRRRAERPEERLDERAVGHRVGARHRAPGEHRAAARGGGFGGGGGQARLPRPRPGDQPDHATAARGHRVDPLPQRSHLGGAPDELRAEQRHALILMGMHWFSG